MIEFFSYDGEWPSLCCGTLRIKVNGKAYEISRGIESGGGFEDDEIDLARKNNMHTITLGKRILRTETAGLAALSMIAYAVEDR